MIHQTVEEALRELSRKWQSDQKMWRWGMVVTTQAGYMAVGGFAQKPHHASAVALMEAVQVGGKRVLKEIDPAH